MLRQLQCLRLCLRILHTPHTQLASVLALRARSGTRSIPAVEFSPPFPVWPQDQALRVRLVLADELQHRGGYSRGCRPPRTPACGPRGRRLRQAPARRRGPYGRPRGAGRAPRGR
eukprot:52369-Prorocentrum_minimum.AAC.2